VNFSGGLVGDWPDLILVSDWVAPSRAMCARGCASNRCPCLMACSAAELQLLGIPGQKLA
jgi:hypothetical protein